MPEYEIEHCAMPQVLALKTGCISCINFVWQSAGSRRANKLQTDSPLAMAKMTSNDCSTSAMIYVRSGESCYVRGVRKCEKNNTAGTQVGAEGGEGGAPGARAEFPPHSMVKTMG